MIRQPLVITESQAGEVHRVALPHGEAVAVSIRSPDKETPNEDAAAIVPLPDDSVVLAVADGVGSSRAAHTASATVVRNLAGISNHHQPGVVRAAIVDAVELANSAVRDNFAGAATTVAIALLDGQSVRPIHVGDSAVIVVGQRGRLKLQTVPHSPVGYAVEAGVMDEGEAMHHEDRHIVSNVVGSDDMRIEIGGLLDLAPRDTLVIATDGVLDNLHLDELIDFVRVGPITTAAQRVIDAVSRRMNEPDEGRPSKPDDTTLILYRRGR